MTYPNPRASVAVPLNTDDVPKATFRQWADSVEELINAARDTLLAPRTYFASPTGNDANNGLTVGAPKTLQGAIDAIAALDTSIFNVTLQLAPGTYGACTLKDPLGAGTCTLVGSNTNAAAYVINAGVGSSGAIVAEGSEKWRIRGLTMQGTGGLYAINRSNVIVDGPVIFGTVTVNAHVLVSDSTITINSNYSITGNAPQHFYSVSGKIFCFNRAVTMSPSLTFSAFVIAIYSSMVLAYGNTYSNAGSATGLRYQIAHLSLLATAGGGASYFPGTTTGVASTGAVYT